MLTGAVPAGWSVTRARLEALMRSASHDELYRSKGIVPLAFAEATAESARQGLPPPTAAQATKLGDTWWLFNGVAGRLTLEPLTVRSLYLPCTFPVPSLYLPCTFPVSAHSRTSHSAMRRTGVTRLHGHRARFARRRSRGGARTTSGLGDERGVALQPEAKGPRANRHAAARVRGRARALSQ